MTKMKGNSMEISPQTYKNSVITLDLNFESIPGTIASYLVPHEHGAVLVECGPGSTLPSLETGLKSHGLKISDITDVLLTHIHLDHAGAAGWLSKQGARIHVHEVGAPHLIYPEKLLASAARIYGNLMDKLWGEFIPVDLNRLSVLHDGDVLKIGGLHFQVLDTPGHANHHLSYLLEGGCFSGDIGGVRLADLNHIRLPLPPPELHFGKWRESLKRLQQETITWIAPTHFGIHNDPEWHLNTLINHLDEIEKWIDVVMPANPTTEELHEQIMKWTRNRSQTDGLDQKYSEAYETVSSSWMSTTGIQRYWRKHIQHD